MLVRDLLLDHVHRLLESVDGQLAIVLHLREERRLDDRLWQQVELIVVKVVLHDGASGPLLNLHQHLLVLVWVVLYQLVELCLVLLHKLLLFEQDGLCKFFVEHVEFVDRAVISFARCFVSLAHFLLICDVLCCCTFACCALISILIEVLLVLLEELADSADAAHCKRKFWLLEGRLFYVDLAQIGQAGDCLRQLSDPCHGDTQHFQCLDVNDLRIQLLQFILIQKQSLERFAHLASVVERHRNRFDHVVHEVELFELANVYLGGEHSQEV